MLVLFAPDPLPENGRDFLMKTVHPILYTSIVTMEEV